jgi:hypothetical protein
LRELRTRVSSLGVRLVQIGVSLVGVLAGALVALVVALA